MKNVGPVLGIVLAAALGACAESNAPGAVAQNAAGAAGARTCSLAQLHNLSGTVVDTPQGVAITFTGPHDDLDQIRENVHAMADANDKQGDAFASCPCGRAPTAGAAEAQGANPYQDQGGRTSMQPTPRTAVAADASVDNIATGAVLKLKAKDKGQIGALRNDARRTLHAILTECRRQAEHGEGAPEHQ
jgi:hypothetical protein